MTMILSWWLIWGDVVDKYTQWQKKFTRVKPFYGTVPSEVYLHQAPATPVIVLCDIAKDGADNFNRGFRK